MVIMLGAVVLCARLHNGRQAILIESNIPVLKIIYWMTFLTGMFCQIIENRNGRKAINHFEPVPPFITIIFPPSQYFIQLSNTS